MVKVFDITPHRRRRRIVQSYSSGAYVPPVWAHWRHLANTTELVLPLAHPSPQPKRQKNEIDWFSRFCTAQAESLYLAMDDPFPQNCPLLIGHLNPT